MRILAIILTLAVGMQACAVAEESSELSGRFVLDGVIPKVRTHRDPWLKTEVPDESLLVDLQTHGIANVVVTLDARRSKLPHPPPRKELADATLGINPRGFSPRIVLLQAGQALVATNQDAVRRNLKAGLIANEPFNVLLESGDKQTFRWHQPEKLPCTLSDGVKPWISGCLVVTDHPYVAVTDVSGRFTIRNLPPGKWTFRAWHERSGFVEQVKHDGEERTWKKGWFTFDIQPGENDMGWIEVPPDEFE